MKPYTTAVYVLMQRCLGTREIYNLLRKLHFNNALSSPTSVGGESRYPCNRGATWRYLCPRTIGEYIHLWRTPSSTPPPPIATAPLYTQGGCFHKESSIWQRTAWRHNLEKGDQTESSRFYFHKMDPDIRESPNLVLWPLEISPSYLCIVSTACQVQHITKDSW